MKIRKPYKLSKKIQEQEYPGFPKGNPFIVPEGYFEGFHQRLMKRAEITAPAKNYKLRRIYRLGTIAAAIVILLGLAVTIFLSRPQRNDSTNQQFFAIDLEDLEQFYPLESLDEYTLVNYYVDNIPNTGTTDLSVMDNTTNEDLLIERQEIKQYLIQSNDLESLITEH